MFFRVKHFKINFPKQDIFGIFSTIGKNVAQELMQLVPKFRDGINLSF
jgi:hypothetical protein